MKTPNQASLPLRLVGPSGPGNAPSHKRLIVVMDLEASFNGLIVLRIVIAITDTEI